MGKVLVVMLVIAVGQCSYRDQVDISYEEALARSRRTHSKRRHKKGEKIPKMCILASCDMTALTPLAGSTNKQCGVRKGMIYYVYRERKWIDVKINCSGVAVGKCKNAACYLKLCKVHCG